DVLLGDDLGIDEADHRDPIDVFQAEMPARGLRHWIDSCPGSDRRPKRSKGIGFFEPYRKRVSRALNRSTTGNPTAAGRMARLYTYHNMARNQGRTLREGSGVAAFERPRRATDGKNGILDPFLQRLHTGATRLCLRARRDRPRHGDDRRSPIPGAMRILILR